MGTRADFYVGRGVAAEWMGSITWDGYPDGIGLSVLNSATEDEYRTAVTEFFAERHDVTYPTEPWPWPWDNSQTTDYAYAYEDGKVYGSSFGAPWFAVDPEAECFGEADRESGGPKVEFPDMGARKGDLAHILGKSGLITATFPTTSEEDGAQ